MKLIQRLSAIALLPVYWLLPINPSVSLPAPAAIAAKPEPAKPEPAKPEPAKPEPAKPEAKKPETAEPDKTPPAKTAPAKTPEDLAKFQKLAAADALYREGKLTEAAELYRQAKNPAATIPAATIATPIAPPLVSPETPPPSPTPPILEAAQLSPAGQVYWREAQAGIAQKLESRTMVPLKLLVEKHPEFIPGSLTLAQVLEDAGKPEAAAKILDRLSGQFPDQPDVLRSRLALLTKTAQWMDASIAARQYALLYPNAPAAQEFGQSADEYLKRYQKQVRSKITGNLIGGIITGAVGYAVTGNIWGPLSSVQTSLLLLRGESAVGDRYARQVQRRLEMVKDEAILSYVNEVGQKLAQVSGRSEFKYEFHVILDDRLNAFALPGGKVFVNAGAIAKTTSEAELAGLLAHELSHAVLSHGFQIATSGSFTANVFQFVPLGGLATDLIVLGYSRKMERQADTLGTRLLAASGYAADGLRNLMVTLDREDKPHPGLEILASHPETQARVNYIEALITQGGYNRYAYEGVERHAQIQARVQQLLDEKKAREEKERDGHKRRRDRSRRSR